MDDVVQEETVRRPCKVDINCNGTKVTVVTYHAPVGGDGPQFGAACIQLLKEIVDPDSYPNIIVAGDFNFRSTDDINASFGPTLGPYHFTRGTFVGGNYLPTVVHSDWTISVPRDLLFYRFTAAAITTISAPANNVLDVPALLSTGAAAPAPAPAAGTFAYNIISNADFRTIVTHATSSASAALKNIFNQALPPTTLGFDTSTAREFFYLYISDHLPVIINFDA